MSTAYGVVHNPLPEPRQAELEALRHVAVEALRAINDWYMAHAEEICRFQPGDNIYANLASESYKTKPAGIVRNVVVRSHSDWTSSLRALEPEVIVNFNRDPRFNYSPDTGGGWTTYETQAEWDRRKESEIENLRRDGVR